MDAISLLVALATALAGAWLGAALYQVRITAPTLRAAGAEGLGFLKAHAARRGTGMFFAAFAALTTLACLAASVAAFLGEGAGAPRAILLVTATIASATALGRGATANRLAEARILKASKSGVPPEELLDAAQQANVATVAVVALAVAFLLVATAMG